MLTGSDTIPMNKRRWKQVGGFSLGEVLLAIAVLVSGILPVLMSTSKSYEVTANSRHLIVASGLAQEGSELVQNVRKNAALASAGFSEWLPTGGASSWDDCRIDIGDDVLGDYTKRIQCGVSSYVLSETSDGSMKHDSGTPGRFKRRIFLDYHPGDGTLDVVSAVYWGDTEPSSVSDVHDDCISANRCVYAESKLAPWN